MSRGARCAFALALGCLLAVGPGPDPALARGSDALPLESDETIGPIRMIGPDEEIPDPITMPDAIPPVSGPSGLVAYEPEGAGTRRHWLDRPSIVVEAPYVRATVVVESSSGARTISHVGFDCGEKALALLAVGGHDGNWRPIDPVEWRPVTAGPRRTPYLTAVYEAVCDGGGPTRSVNGMVERLRNPHRITPY